MYFLMPFILGTILIFVTCSTSSKDIFANVGDDVMFSSVLTPLPQPGVTVSVTKEDGKLLFITRGAQYRATDEYKGRIYFNGNTTAGEFEFTLKHVGRTDYGTYMYLYSSERYEGQTLYVFGKPTKPLLTELSQPLVNESLLLNCSSSSTTVPANHNLSKVYSWYIDGVNILTSTGRYEVNGSGITIKNIYMNDINKTIACIAQEEGGLTSDKSETYVLFPEYGPTQVTLRPSSTSYFINETYQLGPIKCSADCKPSCTYKWIGPSHNEIPGDTLIVNGLLRTQKGRYKCQVTNTFGTQTSSDVIVTVYFPAKTVSMEISVGNNFTISEHSSKTISCLAEGLPKPKITFRYTPNNTILKQVDGERLDFRFHSARCEDSGTYRCDAVNKFIPQQAIQRDVFVLCKPRTAHQSIPNRYISLGETLNISILYLSYPRPTFQWFKNVSSCSYTQLTNSQRDVQINTTAINAYTFESELIRNNLTTNEFGIYFLKAKNVIGTSEVSFIVNAKGTPDQPFGGLATCVGNDVAVLTWSSGFDNGDVQSFSVVYEEVGGTKLTSVSDIRDPGLNKPITFKVESLRESKTYTFRIYSSNTFGDSPQLEVNCSTSESLNDNNILIINGPVMGFIAGIVSSSFVFIILLWRKGLLNKLKCSSGNETKITDTQYDGFKHDKEEVNVYEGINQEGVEIVPEISSIQAEYEHLSDRPESSTYKQLDHKETEDIQMSSIYVNTTVN